ncbi:MAG: hypothetical protein NTZ48_02240 [Candidatus Omnitrophica bacterium]|nr:hypothetical protein [Candidatus Omnitrophota bacterium]
MRVKFYNLEKKDLTDGLLKATVELKGEERGVVTFSEGKLSVEVKDDYLKNILNQPYQVTIRGEDDSGTAYRKTVALPPGTENHLTAVAGGCWRFGYIAEVLK